MATLFSRFPLHTSIFNPKSRLSKLQEFWRAQESTTNSTSDGPVPAITPIAPPVPTTTPPSPSTQQVPTQHAQSDPSVFQPTGSDIEEEFDFEQPSISTSIQAADIEADNVAEIAELIAYYGSASATSWLEFARYKIWRPTVPIPQSSFPPVQGYLRSDPFVFAWGNPVVSDPAALEATCAAFIDWAKSQKLRPIWLCVDGQMEQVLGGQGSKFAWSALSCIVEDFVNPRTVVGLAHSLRNLRNHLRRAERENVRAREVRPGQWTDVMKRQVEEGIASWKKRKTGVQIASVSRVHRFLVLLFISNPPDPDFFPALARL